MKQVISSERLPIKLWLDNIEDGALSQAKNLANLPFAFKHIAIMPDSHQGYGMPIGGVLATKNVVVPNAVGVDIGCGLCALKTHLKEISKDDIKKILGRIREEIPVGFKRHKTHEPSEYMPSLPIRLSDGGPDLIIELEYVSAMRQIGTLGGGNHFIEIQKDEEGYIWIMLHSGSRNLGYKVANHYNKLAVELNSKWFSSVPKKWQLAFLPLDSEEGHRYLQEMNYCVEFAYASRKLMMKRITNIFLSTLKHTAPLNTDPMINIAHNYASMENHFGQNVMVHRKGATLAREDTIGIIPGSQGTSSYIVQGKGNPDSFMSCSHGAGRTMSRTKAKKTLNLEEEIKKMNDKGIIHGMRNKNDLDESSSAYKDIDEVMENQKDLVDIKVKLKPIAVVKG